jgi:hypothetical protein
MFATSVVVLTGAANAAPIGGPLAIIKAVPSVTQAVQWRGGGWGWGPAIAGGIIGGGQSLAARWPPPTALATMVLAITVHRPRLWHTVLLQATRSLTACSGSDLLIRAAGPISETMEIVTPVPEG